MCGSEGRSWTRTSAERRRERGAWLERAESVGPALAESAAESTQLRTLAPQAVAALEGAGLFTIAAPREVGGADLHPATQVEIFESLAAVDASSGWVAMIQSETAGMVGSHLRDGAAIDAVFGDGFPRIAGTANPEGRAAQRESGYRLDGRWSFASGIRHCGWVLANAVMVDDAGQPIRRKDGLPPIIGAVVPQAELEIEDSWRVVGLEGTGSCHYQAHGVEVEPPFTVPFGGRGAHRGGPWFELPTITFLSPGHTGIALGCAKRALALLSGSVGERVRFGAASSISARGAFQRDFGQAHCRYEAARAYAMSVLEEAMGVREQGGAITAAHDARIRAMVTWVTDECLEVVRFALHSGGGAAGFADHPLQQVLRDLTMASQHIYVADSAYERDGAFRLGQPPSGAL